MTPSRFDVVGIGNAIVDIIGRCDEAFLARHGAPKGHMRLVDAATITALYNEMGPAIEVSGGSAANTMVGLASLGGRAAFIGKVADDEFGRIFRHDIRAAGVRFDTPPVGGRRPDFALAHSGDPRRRAHDEHISRHQHRSRRR